MTIFITGGTGALGERLIDRLHQENYNLVVLTRRKPVQRFINNIHYVVGDLTDPETYAFVFEKEQIGAVIHMAAVTHTNEGTRYYRINTQGTDILVNLAEHSGTKRFIFMSTRAVAIDGGDYSNSKRLAEEAVMRSSLDWVILRPAEIYGLSKGEAIGKLLNLIEKYPVVPVMGGGSCTFAPVHIDDVIDAIIRVMERKTCKQKIYNLSGPEEITCFELIRKFEDIKKVRRFAFHIPVYTMKIVAELISWGGSQHPFIVKDQIPRLLSKKSADISLAREDLDFNPAPIDKYIREGTSIH
jgi:nucleoside-diphosphate-sugar epimerase